jgi:hypothetical protein
MISLVRIGKFAIFNEFGIKLWISNEKNGF